MKRLLLLLCLPYLLFGCALCSLYTPTATAEITFVEEKNILNTVHMQWHFSEDFVQELKNRYDHNKNERLDPDELKQIHTILDAYVSKRNYLTTLEHCTPEGVITTLKLRSPQKTFELKEGKLSFYFTFSLNQPLNEKDELSINLEDSQGYFKFLIHSFENKLTSFPKTLSNAYTHVLFIKVSADEILATEAPIVKNLKTAPNAPTTKSWLEEQLENLQETLKSMIERMKNEKSLVAYAIFLGISFLYGLVHAAGPGHGKALVGSYFLASHHRYSKAFSMALLIGIVHTFSAFLLTVMLHLFFDLFFKTFFDNFSYYATKASALIILSIAFYLIVKTLRPLQKQAKIISFSTHPPRCNCGGCSVKSKSTDIGIVLSAGIVPCPGTITIFIFALNIGEYFFGFLSAFFMSLGMSFIIALTATGTLFIRHRFLEQHSRLSTYAHYASLAMMVLLGGILLVG